MKPILRSALSATLVSILAACSTATHRAPVEERHASSTNASSGAAAVKVLPGAENAGKPGYYTVKPGDTLIRISLETGQNWRDLSAWNGLDKPNVIEVGQVLRVIPPTAEPGAASSVVVATKPVSTPHIESRPLDVKPVASAANAAKSTTGASSSGSTPSGAVAVATPTSPAPASELGSGVRESDEPNWTWPAAGPTIGSFEDGKSKGLSIGGKSGDPVLAAGDGKVVYAGSGLRGYGNLVIIKHNGDYLTAYAHNQTLLVKEDQIVRRGQKIAEMGSTDTDRVKLHFEIRKQGKPLDPAKQLPAR